MITIAQPRLEQRGRFAEMAVWHEWPESEELAAAPGRAFRVNVPPIERLVSVVVGGAVAAYGLKRHTLGGVLLAAGGAAMVLRGISGFCPLYHAIGMNEARRGRAEPVDYFERGIQVSRGVTINAPAEALYAFWREFTNLPRIMRHLESVEVIDDLRSHWVARGLLNTRIEWDAEIINEEPNELIAWRSLPSSEIDVAGSVHFERRGVRSTHVHVTLDYIPAAGRLGAVIARVFGRDPDRQIKQDLRRFKHFIEAGDVLSHD